MNDHRSSKTVRLTLYIMVVSVILVVLGSGCPYSDIFPSGSDGITNLDTVHISNSTGIGLVGDTIQVVEVEPEEAEVTCQWQRRVSERSGYSAINGATSTTYELGNDDAGYEVRVAVSGSGEYTGTVYSPSVEVLAGPLTIDIPDITAVQVPVAGHNPVRNFSTGQYVAQVSWSPSDTPFRAGTAYTAEILISPHHGYTCDGIPEDFFTVEGAVSTSNEEDSNTVHAVFAATGNAALVSIDAITGTLQIRQTVTAGPLSPGGATATYRWLLSDETDGEYSPVNGETGASYTIRDADLERYSKVEATGTGSYTGTVTSAVRGPIGPIPVTGLGPLTGTSEVGNTLTMGSVSPSGATVVRFWLASPSIDGVYEEITHAPESDEFVLTAEELGLFIKGRVEGVGLYEGARETTPLGPVESRELESIGPITGRHLVGGTLFAGAIDPLGATVSYQWQYCDTRDGTYENIPGEFARLSTYVVEQDYWETFVRVSVTGTDGYEGTVTSDPVEITYTPGDQREGGGFIFFNKGVRDATVGYMVSGTWKPLEGESADRPWRYLEVAPAGWNGGSTDPLIVWDPTEESTYVNVDEAGQALGMGKANTLAIISTLVSGDCAARLCSSYAGSGDSDWFLPSGAEMVTLGQVNRTTLTEGGFQAGFYWLSVDSAQYSSSMAYYLEFPGGTSYQNSIRGKSNTAYVRPVRFF
ncbi:MAG: DUF1566 domain-containing protein [Sphaerochaetaceae bacterium]|nr:DUF1566 domain-containing protein [Sphaerochaetaceae bacterium]